MSFAYMPLYTGDYLRDTQHLSMMEHGAYLKLLMHSWDQRGPVPLEERKLLGICNARSTDEIEAMRRVLQEFFVQMEDGWYNKRLGEELAKVDIICSQNRAAGLKSAEIRRARSEMRASTGVERTLNGRSTNAGRTRTIKTPKPS